MSTSWLKLWEISSVLLYGNFTRNQVVLDAGGTGTVFSFLLAAEGCCVETIDISEQKVIDADKIAELLRIQMKNYRGNMRFIPADNQYYDKIASICVLEHMSFDDRLSFYQECSRVLKPGGLVCFTFEGALAENEVMKPMTALGFHTVGNETFHRLSIDFGTTRSGETIRHRPFGSFFFRKPGTLTSKPIPGYVTTEAFPKLNLPIPDHIRSILEMEQLKQHKFDEGFDYHEHSQYA
jgi:2-polyprenyl-3-methyl-5-hydroxy-6-metoxy-1,4-benzoquinol methylase